MSQIDLSGAARRSAERERETAEAHRRLREANELDAEDEVLRAAREEGRAKASAEAAAIVEEVRRTGTTAALANEYLRAERERDGDR